MKCAALSTLGLTAFALSLSAVAQAPRGTDPSDSSRPNSAYTDSARGQTDVSGGELKKLDKDKDGMVSKAEADADLTWSKRFKDLDINADGMIDSSEVVALSRNDDATGKGRTAGGKDDLKTPSY